jgi:hypothetical protein
MARLVDALRLVSEGHAPRSSITLLTRQLWPVSIGQGSPFSGNGTASTIFESIWNIEEQVDGDYILRESDLAQFLIWLQEGGEWHAGAAGAQRSAIRAECARRGGEAGAQTRCVAGEM